MADDQSQRRNLWHWLRAVGLAAGIIFIAWLLWRLVSEAEISNLRVAWIGVAEAVAIGILANAAVAIVFSALIEKCATRGPTRGQHNSGSENISV